MIRAASQLDLDSLMGLTRQMHAEGEFHSAPLAEPKVRAIFSRLITGGFLMVNDGAEGVDAMLAGMVSEQWYSTARVASDVIFFVRPTKRGGFAAVRLIQAFVAWGKEQGAAEINIAQSSGVRVTEFAHLMSGMGFDHAGGVFKWRFA